MLTALRSSAIWARVTSLWVTSLWSSRIRELVAATRHRLAKVLLAAAPPVKTKATRTIDLLLRGELRLPPFFLTPGGTVLVKPQTGVTMGFSPASIPFSHVPS